MRMEREPVELKLPGCGVMKLEPPVLMGILNVTPDSFSDGGRHGDEGSAVRAGMRMVGEGARLIDVGGESTRPGSSRVSAGEQIARVVGVIRGLRAELDRVGVGGGAGGRGCVGISVDTTLSEVARAGLDAGAVMVNDVSAGRDDEEMLGLVAERGAPVVLMHMRGVPATMQEGPRYEDVVGEVEGFLLERVEAAARAGVRRERVLVDPGIGFGKTTEHNLELMRGLGRLVSLGFPVVLGASRKRFLREVCAGVGVDRLEPGDLVGATCATTALGVAAGVSVFRVHDVRENGQAAESAWRVLGGRGCGG
jgi:dihydropteroate synthase